MELMCLVDETLSSLPGKHSVTNHCWQDGKTLWCPWHPYQEYCYILSLSLWAAGVCRHTPTWVSQCYQEILWSGVLYTAWNDNSCTGVPLWDKGLSPKKQEEPSWLWEWGVEVMYIVWCRRHSHHWYHLCVQQKRALIPYLLIFMYS